VHGASAHRAAWLIDALQGQGARVLPLPCAQEPTLAMLESALVQARAHGPAWVAALGGGAAMDLGKAMAALIPAPRGALDYLELSGPGRPLDAAPLPFVALPTTSGTGSEVTRNAVIGLPDLGRKVSIRDTRMLARLAIIDPALTDHAPRAVTLASGMDAVVQVIEPYVSCRANAFSDAIARPAIAPGLAAVRRLMQGEDAAARDTMAWVSLSGGLALAHAGLGAVHGLAGVIGGMCPAAHGALCGVLLAPVLEMNRRRATGASAARLDEVLAILGASFGCPDAKAPATLAAWLRDTGLPGLTDLGLEPSQHARAAAGALTASSTKANPVVLSEADLREVLEQAA
jgi:alcohol dehydrogenase class IV